MPADEEEVVCAVGFFNDYFCTVVIFTLTVGGYDGSSVAVIGECESGKIGGVAI